MLQKIGMKKREITGVVGKQLVMYFLCPALFAAVISGIVALYISVQFVDATGVKTSAFLYFGVTCGLFFGIYAIYFTATYIGFVRNVEE